MIEKIVEIPVITSEMFSSALKGNAIELLPAVTDSYYIIKSDDILIEKVMDRLVE